MKVAWVGLGCARALVDSEVALGSLKDHGYEIVPQPEGADIAVVNTCGFIGEAKKESVDAIFALADLKRRQKLKTLVVMGCLSQRHGEVLAREIPEADAILGTAQYAELPGILERIGRRARVVETEPRPRFLVRADHPRHRLTPLHTAYLKVSEGCVNACSYCAIPVMKGPHRSRPVADILDEIARLRAFHPLSEINLIGQDAAAYGLDLEKRWMFADLLRRISDAAPEAWIRILYAHPAHVTPDLMRAIRECPNVARYLDLPIEHSHPEVLRRMNRGVTRSKMGEVISSLREIPGMALRTAVIVGFPGETEEEFEDLLSFMRDVRFERLGGFEFSREEGTRAEHLPGQIPAAEKKRRLGEVMRVQKKITAEWNASRVGQSIRVLIEEPSGEDGVFIGRSEADAPEVDGEVIVHSETPLSPGQFVTVEVTESLDHDVIGHAAIEVRLEFR